MRIVIDMQGAQTDSRFRGIGSYTLSLVKALLENNKGDEIILALNGTLPDSIEFIRSSFVALIPEKNIRIWQSISLADPRGKEVLWRSSLAKSIREAFLESLQPDIILVSSLFEGYKENAVTSIHSGSKKCPTAVIFYDLIPHLFSEQYLDPNPSYLKFYRQKINELKKVDLLLGISAATVEDGIREIGLNSKSLVNISSGYDSKFIPLEFSDEQAQIVKNKFKISKPFILYVGGSDYRKNLHTLIKAYSLLPADLRDQYQLVIAGMIPDDKKFDIEYSAKKNGLNKSEFVFTGYVNDDDLLNLYNLCELFVFPSLYEGFGLPVLEAMACNAPVISSNTSSLSEVVGRDDMMFDPSSAVSVANKITQVLMDVGFRDELKKYGIDRAKQFSWNMVAEKVIQQCHRFGLKECENESYSSEDFIGFLTNKVADLSLLDDLSGHYAEISRVIAQNHPQENRRPKFFVDISELAYRDAKTGIQRVVRSILSELLDNPPGQYDVVPVYGSLDKPGYRAANQFLGSLMNLSEADEDFYVEPQLGDLFLGLDLQHHIVASQAQYLQHLHRSGVKIYFVIYDLLPILMPKAFPSGSSEGHAAWLKEISRYDGVLCISKSVAIEYANWARENIVPKPGPLDIQWFHLGADIENSNPSQGMPGKADELLALFRSRKTFLMVGTVEPRKGHEYVLQEFIYLWSKGVDANLVIVGKKGWSVDHLEEKILNNAEYGKRLFWLNSISDEFLNEVYDASSCLIAASYGEGFGLPLIEAAQHGIPIIARNIPVFKEVAGSFAHYFDSDDSGCLANEVEEWLKLAESGVDVRSKSISFLSWKQSTEMMCRAIFKQKDI